MFFVRGSSFQAPTLVPGAGFRVQIGIRSGLKFKAPENRDSNLKYFTKALKGHPSNLVLHSHEVEALKTDEKKSAG